MKIHLHDYTPDEVRGMEAGELLDWLAWQGIGEPVQQFSNGNFEIRSMSWLSGLAKPWSWEGEDDMSSAGDAAMRALEELNRQARAAGLYATLEGADYSDSWYCFIMRTGVESDELIMGSTAPTPALAIARACALWGLARIEKEKP